MIDVETGVVRVAVPGAVKVTREVWQRKGTREEVHFPQGDTIFVLNYLGEGWWNVWHDGQVRSLDMFWPWERWHTPAGYEYSGEVLQEVQSEFWVFFANDSGSEGWVSGNWPELSSISDADPPSRCQEEDSRRETTSERGGWAREGTTRSRDDMTPNSANN
jgi:hypothetical protein